jgi:hypothetical protein
VERERENRGVQGIILGEHVTGNIRRTEDRTERDGRGRARPRENKGIVKTRRVGERDEESTYENFVKGGNSREQRPGGFAVQKDMTFAHPRRSSFTMQELNQ